MGDWPTHTLREAGVSLIDCDHRTPPHAAIGLPYVAIPQMKGGRLELAEARRISHDHFREWTKKANPEEHDIVLSRRCNPGESAVVGRGERFALGQNLVLLRSDGRRVRPHFLRWLVRGPEWWDQVQTFLNVGAVFDSLRCADVPAFRLKIPPLSVQDQIGDVLGALDDKIDLNRRMNETLEAMARAVFKSWFVDFDPVRAKAEGRAPAGMDAATAALFPSWLVETAQGEVPEGWTTGSLGDAMELKRGYDLPRKIRRAGPVPVVSSSGPSGTHDEVKARGPGVVTGRYGTIGEVFFVREDYWPLNTTLYVSDFKGSKPLWAFHRLKLVDFSKYSDKAAVPGINRNHLHSEQVVIPPSSLQSAFSDIAQRLDEYSSGLKTESSLLASTRDALLPRLLSGEIRAVPPSGMEAA